MNLPVLKNAQVSGKKVFLRADLDVPLAELRIEDETRLLAWMPTLQFLLDNGAKVIVAGHIGRPKGFDKSLSLEPIAKWFSIKYKVSSIKYGKRGEFDGWEVRQNIFLLENLRFYAGEEANNPEFGKKLASLAEICVNDAFATCHRSHASIVGVPRYLPHFAGLRLQKEVEVLGSVLENPVRPLVIVIGGVKIETKLPLVKKMHKIADYVLVGGKIARKTESFFKINNEIKGNNAELVIADLNKNKTDITNKSADQFVQIIQNAKTVVWNGPVGLINSGLGTEKGTREIAEGIAKSRAYTIVGGGDTLGFLRKIHLINKFTFTSTGGGAMLAFLSQESMPGIKALISTVKA